MTSTSGEKPKVKQEVMVVTWNMRTIIMVEKMHEIAGEIIRRNTGKLDIQETLWFYHGIIVDI